MMVHSLWSLQRAVVFLGALSLWCALSGCANSLGVVSDTQDLARPAASSDRDRANLRTELAQVYWRRGQFAVAEVEARRALAMQPHHVGALQMLALTQWANGDVIGAGQTFERAVQHAPSDVVLAQNLAWFKCAGADWRVGLEMLQKEPIAGQGYQAALLRAQCVSPHDVLDGAIRYEQARVAWPDQEVVARLWAEHQRVEGDWGRMLEQLNRLHLDSLGTPRTIELQALAERALASPIANREQRRFTTSTEQTHD